MEVMSQLERRGEDPAVRCLISKPKSGSSHGPSGLALGQCHEGSPLSLHFPMEWGGVGLASLTMVLRATLTLRGRHCWQTTVTKH